MSVVVAPFANKNRLKNPFIFLSTWGKDMWEQKSPSQLFKNLRQGSVWMSNDYFPLISLFFTYDNFSANSNQIKLLKYSSAKFFYSHLPFLGWSCLQGKSMRALPE